MGAVDPNLGVMANVSFLNERCIWVEVMSWSTSSGRSSLCLLSVSTWMSRGHATRSWLVFMFAPYCLRSLRASNLLAVIVHHPEWDVSADSVSLHQLGKVTWEL